MTKQNNRGNHFRRTPFESKELVFAEKWEKINDPVTGENKGYGILQDLFVTDNPGDNLPQWASHVITDKERMITATAIQWLGSNVGFEWLKEALSDCGYSLNKDYDTKEK